MAVIVSQTLFWVNLAVLKITESRVLSCEVPSTWTAFSLPSWQTPYPSRAVSEGIRVQSSMLVLRHLFPPYSVMGLKPLSQRFLTVYF